jgi:DNA-binding GntR family transcriptional regulator
VSLSPPAADQSPRIGDEIHARLSPRGDGNFPSLTDTIYEQLWRRIVNLEFVPGARLSEDQLARELGLSRTPVREALMRLSQTGLVTMHARRGFFVPTVSRQDVIELYDVRSALEVFATRRATPLISDDEIGALRERQIQATARASQDDPAAAEEIILADLSLHHRLQDLGGNPRSWSILAGVMAQLSLISVRSAKTPELGLASLREHSVILDALSHRDVDAAAAAMETHIEAVKRRALVDIDVEFERMKS